MSVKKVLRKLIDSDPVIDGNLSKLSVMTKIPQATISRILSGNIANPRDRTIRPIADYFNVSLEQLKGQKVLTDQTIESTLNVSILAQVISHCELKMPETYIPASAKEKAKMIALMYDLLISKE